MWTWQILTLQVSSAQGNEIVPHITQSPTAQSAGVVEYTNYIPTEG